MLIHDKAPCYPIDARRFLICLCGELHGKHIETAIDNGYGTCYESRCIADEVVDGATQLFGTSEALEGGLAYHVGAALCI